MITGLDLVKLALTQKGDRYIFGVEVDLANPNPNAFDCSEFVEWACFQLGVSPKMPDGSWLQARHAARHNTLCSVDAALATPGALLFKFSANPFTGDRPTNSHVAISQGNGLTIEARSTQLGLGVFTAHNRGWTHAAFIPGIMQTPEDVFMSSWRLAYEKGLLTEHSNPYEGVTTQRLMAFIARLGL